MGGKKANQERRAGDAARRIAQLQSVYDQGYIERSAFESLKREIEARVEQAGNEVDPKRASCARQMG